jgi:hypothetical protein
MYEVTKEARGWVIHGDGPARTLGELTQQELKGLRERGHPGIIFKRPKQEKDNGGGATK